MEVAASVSVIMLFSITLFYNIVQSAQYYDGPISDILLTPFWLDKARFAEEGLVYRKRVLWLMGLGYPVFIVWGFYVVK